MDRGYITHIADIPYVFAKNSYTLTVRIRVKKFEVLEIKVFQGDRYNDRGNEQPVELKRVAWDSLYDYFETDICITTKRLRYYFEIIGLDGEILYLGERSCSHYKDEAGIFEYAYICEEDVFKIPDWSPNSVVYEIYIDSFWNGELDEESLTEWGNKSSENYFYGCYGVNLIYFTPIFPSPTNHKYDISNYYNIDSQFGNLTTFRNLVEEANKKGMKIILDAVFNHTGDEFFAFKDIKEKGEKSKYYDWYFINELPLSKQSYETFSTDVFNMPKLNFNNPEVKEYFLDVGKYWIKNFEVSGWRIDVANEVSHDFWRTFRKEIKQIEKDSLLIGEVWHNAAPWLRGDEFDGTMNYPLRELIVKFFCEGSLNIEDFNHSITKLRMSYPHQANLCMFNLLSSHDTDRFLFAMKKNNNQHVIEKYKLAITFLFTYIGIPVIYYGDEVGRVGEDIDQGGERGEMIWEEEFLDKEVFNHYKGLIKLRKKIPSLQKGNFINWLQDEEIYGYKREYDGHVVGIILNNTPRFKDLTIKCDWKQEGEGLYENQSGRYIHGNELEKITLSPFSSMILT